MVDVQYPSNKTLRCVYGNERSTKRNQLSNHRFARDRCTIVYIVGRLFYVNATITERKRCEHSIYYYGTNKLSWSTQGLKSF